MELDEALSKVQSLSAFFKGLRDLDEILQTAIVARNLRAENEKAADKARQEKLLAQTELQQFRDNTTAVMKEMREKTEALQSGYLTAAATLDAKLAAKEADTTAAIQLCRRKQAEAEDELRAAIELGESRKAELEKQITALEKALNALKAKAASL